MMRVHSRWAAVVLGLLRLYPVSDYIPQFVEEAAFVQHRRIVLTSNEWGGKMYAQAVRRGEVLVFQPVLSIVPRVQHIWAVPDDLTAGIEMPVQKTEHARASPVGLRLDCSSPARELFRVMHQVLQQRHAECMIYVPNCHIEDLRQLTDAPPEQVLNGFPPSRYVETGEHDEHLHLFPNVHCAIL
eukprot:1191717-Prorocentrum_minimum.AAC.2